jgi:hypothetical protein
MMELKGQRSLRVTVNSNLYGLLGFISIAQDLPRDHLVESLLLTALAGEKAFAPHEREAIEEVSARLFGFDLAAMAKKRLGEGILTRKPPPGKTSRPRCGPIRRGENMIAYATFAVRMSELWLPDDVGEIEALRLSLLQHARSLHATRVKPGSSPAEDDVQVERIESIGGLYNEPVQPGPGEPPSGA